MTELPLPDGTITPGTTFGVRTHGGKDVDLYCKATHVANGKIDFEVINGLWDGSIPISGSGLLKILATGREIPAEICFIGSIPKERRKDYNSAIAYMNEVLSMS